MLHGRLFYNEVSIDNFYPLTGEDYLKFLRDYLGKAGVVS